MSDQQRTPEWFKERSGKFTGSRFADVLSRNKRTGAPNKAYHDLIWQIVVERLTGVPTEGPNGFALQWGQDVEPYAREAYELETGLVVSQTGFIIHPEFEFVGCSPDGLIGKDGGLEMKCPKSSEIHLERFLSGIPEEYIPQVHGSMWVTGREWWDFVSYDPRMPEQLRMFRIRINRDEKYIQTLSLAVQEAEELVKERISAVYKAAA